MFVRQDVRHVNSSCTGTASLRAGQPCRDLLRRVACLPVEECDHALLAHSPTGFESAQPA